MSKFYRMDPWAWDDGTAGLTLEQEAAYLRIVNATNKSDEPILANRFAMAGMFRCSTEKAMRLLRDLEAAGKVQIIDGRIHNKRAGQEIEYRRNLSATRAQAASNRQATHTQPGPIPSPTDASKSLKSNNQPTANAPLIEENRIEESIIPLPPRGGERKGFEIEFETFCSNYPKRRGSDPKKPALEKYCLVRKRGVSAETLRAGARAYARECTDDGKIDTPYVSQKIKWLNQEQWNDYAPQTNTRTEEQRAALIRSLAS
jgi:uncharacterized protein YdaU (DUF1376 family)